MPLLSKVLPGTKYDRPWGLQGLHRLLSIVFILRCTRCPLATRAMRPTLAPRGGSKTVSGVYDAQQGACLKPIFATMHRCSPAATLVLTHPTHNSCV